MAVVNTLITKTQSSKEIAEFCFKNAHVKSICKELPLAKTLRLAEDRDGWRKIIKTSVVPLKPPQRLRTDNDDDDDDDCKQRMKS